MYARSYIKPIPNITPRCMGLQEAYESWQRFAKIKNYEAAISTHIVGGQ